MTSARKSKAISPGSRGRAAAAPSPAWPRPGPLRGTPPRSSHASTTSTASASTNCAQARASGGEDRWARAFSVRAERRGGECSLAWGMPRSHGICLTSLSSAWYAARFTSGASLRPGRCTAPGPCAGIRTTGSIRPRRGRRRRQAIACRANEPTGTARPVPASDSYLARSPADLLHLRLRVGQRSREPAALSARLTPARPGARAASPLPLLRPGPHLPPRARR